MKRFAIAAAAAVLLIPGGCDMSEYYPWVIEGESVIRCESDEIKNASWEFSSGEISSKLTFDGDTAYFSISSGDISAEITGICVIDDGTMIILDELSDYCFDYKLHGHYLTLTYNGQSIEMSAV